MSLWDKIKWFVFNNEPRLIEQMNDILEQDAEQARKEKIELEIQQELKKRKARKKKSNASTI